MTLVAYSNAGTPALADDRRDRGRARQGLGQAALLQHRVERQRRHRRLPDRQRRSVRRPRRAAIAVATAVSDLQATFIDINPEPAPCPYRLCVTAAGDRTDVRLDTTLAVGDREIVTVILSRTPGAVLLNGARAGAGGRRDAGGQRLGPGAPGGGRRLGHGDGVLRHGVGIDGRSATRSPLRRWERTASCRPAPALEVTWTGGAVTAADEHDQRRRRLHPAGGHGTRPATATATLLPDDNARSTNAAKPVKMRLVHGATTDQRADRPDASAPTSSAASRPAPPRPTS